MVDPSLALGACGLGLSSTTPPESLMTQMPKLVQGTTKKDTRVPSALGVQAIVRRFSEGWRAKLLCRWKP